MKNVKNTLLKSVKFSLITFGMLGLFSSLNAANIITGGASKKDCEDTNCEFGRIGIGGGYYGLQGSNANADSYIGYVSLGIKEVYKARFQGAFDIVLGGGRGNLKGSAFPQGISKSGDVFIFEPTIKFGVNVLTKRVPLFVNIVGGIEGYRLGFNNDSTFRRVAGLVGVELNGEIPAGDRLRFTYGAGYSWIARVDYDFGKTTTIAKGSIKNYAVNANIGLEYDLPKGLYTYAKLIGKYQHNNATSSATYNGMQVSYPASDNFVGMLEIGLGV